MQYFLRDLSVWCVAVVSWFLDAWRVWAALAIVVVVALVSRLLPGSIEDEIRYSGLMLQLLGVATVVVALRDKRRIFGRPGLVENFRLWVAACPRLRRKQHTVSLSGVSTSCSTGSATLSSWKSCAANAPLSERIVALESNFEILKEQVTAENQRSREETTRLRTAIDSERVTREMSEDAIREKVEAFGAGGLHIEATGLFWLILGIVLATIPLEMAHVFHL